MLDCRIIATQSTVTENGKEIAKEQIVKYVAHMPGAKLKIVLDGAFDFVNASHFENLSSYALKPRAIFQIAKDISKVWGRAVNYAAKPYLDAMYSLTDLASNFGMDNARSILLYFLSNASDFRGKEAAILKTELKIIAGQKLTKKERENYENAKLAKYAENPHAC